MRKSESNWTSYWRLQEEARAPSPGLMQPMVRVPHAARLLLNSTRFFGLVAEDDDNHIASDAQFVGVLPAEQAAQGPDKARVRHGSGDGGP